MRVVLIGLVLLLALQLTGLSCVGESASVLTGDRSSASVSSSERPTIVGASDDGCPCHLLFVSIPSQTVDPSTRIVFADPPPIEPHALDVTSLPFHPPLTR